MRVMFTVAVLLSGIACISKAEAQVCGDRDCNRCLVYAGGKCIKRGADPACEARKKKCLAEQKFRGHVSKRATTAAPRPRTVAPRDRLLLHRLLRHRRLLRLSDRLLLHRLLRHRRLLRLSDRLLLHRLLRHRNCCASATECCCTGCSATDDCCASATDLCSTGE